MKKLLLLALLCIGINRAIAIKPTQIYVSNFGKIEHLYFDLQQSLVLAPLSGLEIDGKGNVTALQIQVGHTIIQFDQFGVPVQPVLQGQFKVQYNHNHKIEKIKNYQNQLLLKLEYDFNGRLVKLKDGNYDTRLKLYYNYDGRLTAVADGNFNKKIRLYFNFNDDLTGIKNENLDYEYKLYYNWDDQLEKIKSRDYVVRAKFIYNAGTIQHIETYNMASQIIVGNYNNYPNGYGGTHPHCNIPPQPVQSALVSLYVDAHHQGQIMQLGVGDYPKMNHGWNDRISSIRVPNGYKIIIYEHENFGGACQTLTGQWSVNQWNDFWNDRISSFRILPL